MPKEVRYILFSPEEALQALVEGLATADAAWRLEAGRFRLDIATAASGEVTARLVLRRPDPGRRSSWQIEAADILTMLLQFCRRGRIPLPLRGHKRLELIGTCLCLEVTLSKGQPEPAMSDGLLRYVDPELAPLMARR